jgi:hypothetical protein
MKLGAFIEMIKTRLKRILWGKVDEQAPTVIDQKETNPLEAPVKEISPTEAPAPKKDEQEKKPAAAISKPKKKRKRRRGPRWR